MFERSKVKRDLFECLRTWDYNKAKCGSYGLAKRMNCSQDMVGKILRNLKDNGMVRKSKGGSYHLI